MEAIILLVSNPEWWFTAVVISIITGIFASYAKDWLSKLLSFGSDRIKQRNIKEKIERQKRISCYLENPTLLLIAYQEITQLICFFMLFILISVSFPAYNTILANAPDVEKSSGAINMIFAGHVRKEVSSFMSFACASMAMLLEMMVLKRIKDCRKASRLIKKQTLDKLSSEGVSDLLP